MVQNLEIRLLQAHSQGAYFCHVICDIHVFSTSEEISDSWVAASWGRAALTGAGQMGHRDGG